MKKSPIKTAGLLVLLALAGSVIAALFLLALAVILQFGFDYNQPYSGTVLIWTYSLFQILTMIIGVKWYYRPARKLPVPVWVGIIFLGLALHYLMLHLVIRFPLSGLLASS